MFLKINQSKFLICTSSIIIMSEMAHLTQVYKCHSCYQCRICSLSQLEQVLIFSLNPLIQTTLIYNFTLILALFVLWILFHLQPHNIPLSLSLCDSLLIGFSCILYSRSCYCYNFLHYMTQELCGGRDFTTRHLKQFIVIENVQNGPKQH